MGSKIFTSIERTARQIPRPPVSVVIVYEDFAAGTRAIDTCNFLGAASVGRELRRSMWKFDVLRSAKLLQMAVEDAAQAAVIIVTYNADTDLPPEVKRWVNAWVPHKQGRPAVLLAVPAPGANDADEMPPANEFLKSAAARAGIPFLTPDALSSEELQGLLATDVPGPVLAAATAVAHSRPAPEGWGLND